MPDGDIWHNFQEAACAKGPHSIRITKVKGHVSQVQVDANLYRHCDMVGNNKADEAADVAVETHGKDVISVARILHNRHLQYMRFMQQVSRHIVEGYLIHRRLLEIEDSKQKQEQPKGALQSKGQHGAIQQRHSLQVSIAREYCQLLCFQQQAQSCS